MSAFLNILSIFLCLYSFEAAAGNDACSSLFQIRSQPSFTEVQRFIESQNILGPKVLAAISEQALRYGPADLNERGNALLRAAFDLLGPRASRQKDLLVDEFLRPDLLYHLEEFRKLTNSQAPAIIFRVPALYDLQTLGFISVDAYRVIHWNKAISLKFIDTVENIFTKKFGFNLVEANKAIVQIEFLLSMMAH